MKNTFVAISSPGPNRDPSKGTREQPLWDEHAAFIDQLVAEGFVLMGGPLVDDGGAMLIVNADDENEAREKLENDPWMEAWRSQAGECPPLANLHRCQEVVTLTALVTREIRFQFAREPIARERDVMQFARSTLRFLSLTALGVVFV